MTDRTVSVKLLADVAQYMASMRAAGSSTNDLEKAARDVRKAHADQADAAGKAAVAEAKLSDVQADGKAKAGQLAAAQEQVAKAHRDLAAATDNATESEGRFRKAQQDSENEASKTAQKVQGDFNALKFTALSAGLPAAALAGAAGVGLALAVVPGIFAAIGVSAVASTDEVQYAWMQMTTNVASSTNQMAQRFKGPVVDAIGEVNTSFNRLAPQVEVAMQAATGAVDPLVGSVTDFAENAMPGMVRAILASDAPLQGLRSLSGQVGTGLGTMFTNMTAGSTSAGQGLATLGGIVDDLLGFLGTLFAQIANGSAGPLSQLQAMLRAVEGTLTALTSSGSGALGFLSGFSSGATGMLTVLEALARGLSMLPPQVTQFAGSFAAVSTVAKQFGVDAGSAFEGLGKSIANSSGPVDKMKTAVTGLALGAMSPALIVTGALAVGMEILGQKEKDAAAAAQAQAERVQTLADALRKSNGAIDDNVRATAAQTLSNFKTSDGYRNLLGDAQKLGISLPTLTDAYLGNQGAIDSLNGSLTASVGAHRVFTGQGADTAQVVDDEGKKYQDFQNILNSGDFGKAVADNKNLADATANSVKPTSELDSAIETLKGTAADASTRINALKSALDILNGRTPVFEDAIKSGNDALRGMADNLKNGTKAADGMGKALINADGTINTVTKNGSDLQGIAEGLQTSFTTAASGIQQMVDRGVPLDKATQQVKNSLQEQRDAFIKNAGAMGLNATQAGALADKYGLIPDKVTTLVTANVKQAQDAIDALPAFVDGKTGVFVLSADSDPATGQIEATVKYADGSTGVVTITGNRDPATGQVLTAVHYADGTTGTMTLTAAIQAAKDQTLTAVRYADGSTGFISLGVNPSTLANVENEIDYAARNRTSVVTINTVGGTPGAMPAGNRGRVPQARGGVLSAYADGGIRRFAGGALANARPLTGGIAAVINPGDLRIIGDNMQSKEYYIPANGSARSRSILAAANADPSFGNDSVRQSIQSGTAVVQTPGVGSSSSAAGGGLNSAEVHVWIGDREITDIVRTEIRQTNRSTKRAVTAGAGASR